MIHWLITTAVPKIENAALYTLTSGLVATFILAPFRNVLKRVRRHLSAALDSLDPDVPVGLTKQLDDVLEKLTVIHQHLNEPLTVKSDEPIQVKVRNDPLATDSSAYVRPGAAPR